MESLAEELEVLTQSYEESQESSPIILNTDNWKVREINNKLDAIHYGRDRGWCTANPDAHHYDLSYTKDKGDLYILYKNVRERPIAQLFVSKNKSMELRRAQNAYVPVHDFVRKHEELLEWFTEVGYVVSKPMDGSVPSRGDGTYAGITNLNLTINDQDNVTVDMTSNGTLETVNSRDELPDIQQNGIVVGQMFFCVSESCMYVCTGEDYIPVSGANADRQMGIADQDPFGRTMPGSRQDMNPSTSISGQVSVEDAHRLNNLIQRGRP